MYIKTVVMLLLSALIASHILFVFCDTGNVESDGHLRRLLDWHKFFTWSDTAQFLPRVRMITHPPLVYWVSELFLVTLGLSIQSAKYSLVVFLVIFALSMYGIGKYYGDEWTGITCLALSSSLHCINQFRICYFLDFSAVAMTAFSFYQLLKTQQFTSRRNSILFGIVFAFAMLTKWSVFFFMALPILWFIVPALICRENRRKGSVINVLISVLTCCVCCLPWYIWVWNELVHKCLNDNRGRLVFLQKPHVLEALMILVPLYLLILLIIGAVSLFFRKKGERYAAWVLPANLLFGVIVIWRCTLYAEIRYALIFDVFVVAMAALWVNYTRFLKQPLALLMALLSIFLFSCPLYPNLSLNPLAIRLKTRAVDIHEYINSKTKLEYFKYMFPISGEPNTDRICLGDLASRIKFNHCKEVVMISNRSPISLDVLLEWEGIDVEKWRWICSNPEGNEVMKGNLKNNHKVNCLIEVFSNKNNLQPKKKRIDISNNYSAVVIKPVLRDKENSPTWP